MKIYADTEEKRLFFSTLEKIPIKEEVIENNDEKHYSAHRIKFIEIDNIKIDYYTLAGYFETLENRFQLAKYCLREISKDCEIKTSEEISYRDMRKKAEIENIIEPQFYILAEYFTFAIKTCLDIMSHVLNILFDLELAARDVEISKIRDKMNNHTFGILLSEAYYKWISQFNEIRRIMTHHDILRLETSIVTEENKTTYYKHRISASSDKYGDISEPLPTYFESIIENFNILLKSFYESLIEILQRQVK